jgi:integrase
MLVVSHTKTGKVRRVPLEQDLFREIRTRVGRLVPFSVKSCGAFNRHVRKLSSVPAFKVKQARSTFACRWLEQGGILAALQEILGHTTIVTTQRYARLSEDHVRHEAERIFGKSGTVAGTGGAFPVLPNSANSLYDSRAED